MRILVLQHLVSEHPGIFRDFMRADGVTWQTAELDEGGEIPPLDQFDAMLVMGGPQDVWQTDQFPWLVPEIEAIRTFVVDMQRPYLGICLGHQLLAAALGGTVGPAREGEVGVLPVALTDTGAADPLFAGVLDPLPVLQWHGAEVSAVPDGVSVLAKSQVCPIQSIRYGAHAYGVQFHLEATASTVADWAAVPEYAAALDRAMGQGATLRLEAEVARTLPAFNASARTIYENFKALSGW